MSGRKSNKKTALRKFRHFKYTANSIKSTSRVFKFGHFPPNELIFSSSNLPTLTALHQVKFAKQAH